MLTLITLFIAGIAIGYGLRWIRTREHILDLQAEVDGLNVECQELTNIANDLMRQRNNPWG